MPSVPSSELTAVNNLGANVPPVPSRVGLVLGPTVSGTANSIIHDDSVNTALANFGAGPGTEVAGTALTEPNHGTVYQIKTPTSTAGTIGSVTKTTGAVVGAASDAYGAVLSPGADVNGDVLFTAKVANAELEIVTGAAEATSVVGSHVKLTINVGTTTGASLAALITGDPAALALWGAVASGTGASLNSSTLATYSEAAGRIVFQALKAGISYKLTASVAGPPGPALVALTTGGTVVEVTLATNVNGEIASDALTIQSLLVALAAANPGVFTTALAGSGSGLIGAKTITSLSFGSTGTMTVSGTPNDTYSVTVQIVTAGGLGTAAFQVALGTSNGVPIFGSAIYQIPAGGVIVIPETGLTLTFAGTFDALDKWTFDTVAPLSTMADVLSALTYFMARPEQASLIAIAGQIPLVALPAWVAALNVAANQLEAVKKYVRIMMEIEGPAVGQSNAAWGAAVNAAVINLSSARLCICAGKVVGVSALPLPQPGRPETVVCMRNGFARALALDPGIDVGDQTVSGALTSVTSGLQTDVAASLAAARLSYGYLLAGVPGIQFEGLLFDSPTGDFTNLAYGRVLDAVMFVGYLRQTKYLSTAQRRNLDGTIKLSAAVAIQNDLRNTVINLLGSQFNDLQVVVDRTNTDGKLKITYYVQPLLYIKEIIGRAGIKQVLLTATQTL